VSPPGPLGPASPGQGEEPPEGAAAWHAAGFVPEEAQVFQRWRISLAEAEAWRQVGVPDGLRAAQWTTAGATPSTVSSWRAAGIDAGEAVHWHEMGYDLRSASDARRRGLTPDTAFASQHPSPFGGRSSVVGAVGRSLSAGQGDHARKFLEAGVPGQVLLGYVTRNWTTDDALPWAKAGVDAGDAQLWRLLGLEPAEAARLAAKGGSPAETVRDWWQAGIPFDEAADWIGAGLTPKEAAEQRAKGITAEQAAALRALRDQDPDDLSRSAVRADVNGLSQRVPCQNPARGLTCWFTLNARAHSPRLPVHGPGVRLAGAPGPQ
jgi:hypothetical protein